MACVMVLLVVLICVLEDRGHQFNLLNSTHKVKIITIKPFGSLLHELYSTNDYLSSGSALYLQDFSSHSQAYIDDMLYISLEPRWGVCPF